MKKVFNVFLGIIAFVAILCAGVLIGGRNIFSGNNMSKLLNIVVDEKGEESLKDAIFDDTEYKGFSDYVDEKKLEDALGDYVSNYFKVEVGISSKMDSSKLSKVLKDAAEEYNEDHDKEISSKEIDRALDRLDKEVIKESKLGDEEKKVFKAIFSNSTLFIFIAIAALFLFFIYLVSKSLKTLFFHIGLTTLISGLIIKFGSSGILNYALNDSSFTGSEDAMETIFNAVGTIGIIGIVIGIVCFVLSFVFGKKAKSKPSPTYEEEVTREPEEYVTKDLVPDAETVEEAEENSSQNDD